MAIPDCQTYAPRSAQLRAKHGWKTVDLVNALADEYSLSSASCSSMKLVFAPSRSLKCNGLPWVSMTMRAPFNRIGWNWMDEWRAQPLASA
jgi:hypothetical protein